MANDERFSFATGTNAHYIESLYEDFRKNPASVDETWRRFFEGYEFASQSSGGKSASNGGGSDQEAKMEAYINAFRTLGHLSAHLNPLAEKPNLRNDMKPEYHGLSNIDSKKIFHPSNLKMEGQTTFEGIFEFLTTTYCNKIGADYREMNDIEAVVWLQEQMEACKNQPTVSKEMKLRILDKLNQTEGFERFLQDRYLGQKRFSIEGLDAMVSLLDVVSDEAAQTGVEEICVGMAHRGRLNVLANFMGKPYEQILHEFEGGEYNPMNIEGDVKYHKGFASEIETFSKKKIRLYLSPNPSHLEAVNPVVEGFVRARQRMFDDTNRTRVVPILIHGDAAVTGQGVVFETLNMASLKAYTTGGTIHVIANNQLGFTANPDETMSCTYSSDFAKFIRAPVLHVNADDPEAVVWCARLAVEFRQKFKRDVVIDLIGYRRYGHNETDEPGFTQPLMYKEIKKHPTVLKIYSDKLIQEGVVTAEDVAERAASFRSMLQAGMLTVREGKFKVNKSVPKKFEDSLRYTEATYEDIWEPINTAIAKKELKEIGTKITNLPSDFHPHPKIEKLFETRRGMLEGKGSVDWGLAELLAYGSIAKAGHHIRLSGQDCRRGTFSHRHAVLRDYENGSALTYLNNIAPNQARVNVINSSLSEAGVLGFEFGYSVADKNALVIWEAQFGDFSNGAQIIMDQFLVASEAKWKQTCSLVLLLPHGYEGQGPEHSSARPERFLQLCGNLNIQVANLTTPSQIFHILRRQVLRSFQKPLVIMTPKSLLRHPKAISTLADFCDQGFSSVIDDAEIKDPGKVKKLVMCTGKVYYDLLEAREKNQGKALDVPLVRIEQLYPFPNKDITAVLERYSNVKEIIWTQEEPANMGAWTFMRPHLEALVGKGQQISYIGRKGSGSTAEGSLKSHLGEQQRIVQEALGLASTLTPKSQVAGR